MSKTRCVISVSDGISHAHNPRIEDKSFGEVNKLRYSNNTIGNGGTYTR